LELQDYPTLYRESDSSAINAQKRHFWLVRTKVALLLVIAGVASIAWSQEPNLRTSAAVVLAIFLVVSIVLSAIMDMRKFDRVWFSSRAIAESVKTESWSFMMKVEPYDGTIPDSEAEERFLSRLDKILHLQPSVCSELTPYLQQGALITNHMRQMRNESLENRRTYYVQSRIRDQRSWYAKKAKWNKDREALWFIITWILQIAAAVIAIIVIGFRDLIINPVGILTTAGASALSWLHARSYRELSQTYGLVTQELALLEERANKASTEEKLAEIVLDVERTISREHTIWLARRL
jgi:hypothetical protein